MTHEQIQALARQYLSAWERGDAAAVARCYSDAARVDSPMFHTVIGRESIEKSFVDLFRGLANWQFTIEDIVIDTTEPARAVLVLTTHAAHVGELFGFRGTGRRVSARTVLSLRFDGDRISSEMRLYDFTGLLVQLGVLKAKGG
jgi:steroid delta-isomerase-like uncharacterized protein